MWRFLKGWPTQIGRNFPFVVNIAFWGVGIDGKPHTMTYGLECVRILSSCSYCVAHLWQNCWMWPVPTIPVPRLETSEQKFDCSLLLAWNARCRCAGGRTWWLWLGRKKGASSIRQILHHSCVPRPVSSARDIKLSQSFFFAPCERMWANTDLEGLDFC